MGHTPAQPLRMHVLEWTVVLASVLSLCVCENRDGWLVACGLCGCMLILFSAVWLVPFTLL